MNQTINKANTSRSDYKQSFAKQAQTPSKNRLQQFHLKYEFIDPADNSLDKAFDILFDETLKITTSNS